MTPAVSHIILRGTDPDATAYCARSGATDKATLNQFVKGVKGMGLWSSLICWPMCSTQNAGTGTTVYSLGGYGAANLTLTNGPTWGATGISFTGASSHYASSTAVPDTRTGTLISVFSSATLTAGLYVTHFSNSVTRSNGVLARIQPDGTQFQASTVPASSAINLWTDTAFHMATAVRGSTTFNADTDTGSFTAGSAPTAILNSITGLYLCAREDIEFFGTAVHAFCMVTSTELTSSQKDSFYNLYKQTLGAGLSLP